MNRIVFLLLLFLYILNTGLPEPAKAQSPSLADTSFMQVYCAGNYPVIDGFFDKGKAPVRLISDQSAFVYRYPDKNAMVIDTLKAFTAIVCTQEGTDPLIGTKWLKVKYERLGPNGNYVERDGYIIDDQIGIGTANSNSSAENIDFVLGESPLLDPDLKQPRFRLYAVHRFTGLNYREVSKVAVHDLSISAINNYNHFYLTRVYNVSLSNMPDLLRLYWHHGESCPESEGNVFVTYKNGRMNEITHSYFSGEADISEFTKVYIPLKFGDGKILLVENGDSEHMFNSWDATLKTIPYPKNCKVPITQLVVTVQGDTESGKAQIVRYYRWDGEKLIHFSF